MDRKSILNTVILILLIFYVGYFSQIQTTNKLETLVATSTSSIVYIEVQTKERKEKKLNKFFQPKKTKKNPLVMTGTGFFISPEYIITNTHVINDGLNIKVYTNKNASPIMATIIGKDEQTDIAVLKINSDEFHKRNIRTIKWGASNLVRLGQPVYAIGHPFGLTFSVTKGIISFNGRYIINPYQEVIQTDTAVNRGNSGGPLFDMNGNVIGVNTFIFGGEEGGSIGLNFAVSQFTAEFIAKQLIEKGKIERAWMGIGLNQNITKTVIINTILDNGPASKTDLFIGDEVVSINGYLIKDMQDFFTHLEHNVVPKQEINLNVRRYGDTDKEPTIFNIKMVMGVQPPKKED